MVICNHGNHRAVQWLNYSKYGGHCAPYLGKRIPRVRARNVARSTLYYEGESEPPLYTLYTEGADVTATLSPALS